MSIFPVHLNAHYSISPLSSYPFIVNMFRFSTVQLNEYGLSVFAEGRSRVCVCVQWPFSRLGLSISPLSHLTDRLHSLHLKRKISSTLLLIKTKDVRFCGWNGNFLKWTTGKINSGDILSYVCLALKWRSMMTFFCTNYIRSC